MRLETLSIIGGGILSYATYEMLNGLIRRPFFSPTQTTQDWCRMVVILGDIGSGKSTLLRNIFYYLTIERGWGGLYIDTQGQADRVYRALPREQAARLVPLIPFERRVLGFNPLSQYEYTEMEAMRIANDVAAVLHEQNKRAWGPNVAKALTAGMYACLLYGDTTLVDVFRFFQDGEWRETVLRKCANVAIRRFFADEDVTKAVNKVDSPLMNDTFLAVFGQRKGLDLYRAFDERRIIVADLDQSQIGGVGTMIGGTLLAAVKQAASQRTEDSPPAVVCIDEYELFQSWSADSTASLIETMRKKNICLCVALQGLYEIASDRLKGALMLAGNRYFLRPHKQDVAELMMMQTGSTGIDLWAEIEDERESDIEHRRRLLNRIATMPDRTVYARRIVQGKPWGAKFMHCPVRLPLQSWDYGHWLVETQSRDFPERHHVVAQVHRELEGEKHDGKIDLSRLATARAAR